MNAISPHTLTESHSFSRSVYAGDELVRSPAGRPGILGRVADVIRLWRLRARARRAFVLLDQRDLHDIGLSRWEVEQEMVKPFWRE